MPDVAVYNSVDELVYHQPSRLSNALIYSNGKVLFVPSVTTKSVCKVNEADWPYGQQVVGSY